MCLDDRCVRYGEQSTSCLRFYLSDCETYCSLFVHRKVKVSCATLPMTYLQAEIHLRASVTAINPAPPASSTKLAASTAKPPAKTS